MAGYVAISRGRVADERTACEGKRCQDCQDPFSRAWTIGLQDSSTVNSNGVSNTDTKALKDTDGHVRVSAALALWQVSDKTEPSLGILIACLKIPKEHDYVQDAAAGASERWGPQLRT